MSANSNRESGDGNELVRRRKLQEHLFAPSSTVSQTTLDVIKSATIRRAKTGDAESLRLLKDFPEFFRESTNSDAEEHPQEGR
jgi:hypothetical protein